MTPPIRTPPEMARQIGVTGLKFRTWLRKRANEGHEMLVGHVKHGHWEFSEQEARQLMREFRAEVLARANPAPPVAPNPRATTAQSTASAPGRSAAEHSADPGHRVDLSWRGSSVETLDDLLRPGLLAVVVGINPAPVSVAAGHYWQGSTGRTLWRRLRRVGLLPDDHAGFEDDAAFAAGVGFTDVVKRPTRGAADLASGELESGRGELEGKLIDAKVPLVIFAFKKAAVTLLGPFDGNGFVPARLGGAEVFVMPGPYESAETADATLRTLADRVAQLR
jgi:TDG/mug DNA glycosylase family protein